MKKTYQMLIALLLICGSVFCDRVWLKIKATNENNWVYSVNNISADANGNVNVTAINNKTVNSNVPSTADFAQYNQNSTDISAIITRLSGLTATADKVANGYTFVGTNGLLQTGTFSPSITVLAAYTETKVGIDEYCTWDVTRTAPAGTTHVFLHNVKYGGSGGWLYWYKNGSQFSPGNNTIQPCAAGNTIRYYSRTYGSGGSTNRYADTYLITFLKIN